VGTPQGYTSQGGKPHSYTSQGGKPHSYTSQVGNPRCIPLRWVTLGVYLPGGKPPRYTSLVVNLLVIPPWLFLLLHLWVIPPVTPVGYSLLLIPWVIPSSHPVGYSVLATPAVIPVLATPVGYSSLVYTRGLFPSRFTVGLEGNPLRKERESRHREYSCTRVRGMCTPPFPVSLLDIPINTVNTRFTVGQP